MGALLWKIKTVKVLVFAPSNKAEKYMLQVHLIYQSIQYKLNASAKIGNISISGKVKVVV